MKNLLFITVMVLIFIVCKNKASAQNTNSTNISIATKMSQEEKEERNKRIALANAEAIHHQDIDGAVKNFAPNIINYGNGSIPPQKGVEAVTASLRMFIKAFPLIKLKILLP